MKIESSSLQCNFLGLSQLDDASFESCADLYCQIWKEAPWFEFFWEKKSVLADLKKQSKKMHAELFLASQKTRVIGFTWGYCVNSKELRDISGTDKMDFLFNNGKVFYIDELGVDRDFRKNGIGENLSCLIIDFFLKNGAGSILLRTDIKAFSAKRLYQKIGFSEMFIFDAQYKNRNYWLFQL